MDLELRLYPDDVLRRVAEPVGPITDEIRALVPRLMAKMYETRGVGLAAPQVGLSLRLVVANEFGNPEIKEGEEVWINPVILEREGAVRGEEGCLSLPGITGKILRAQKIVVRYTDLEGVERTVTALDWKARIFQHEIDHLDGILIIDKMSPAELAFAEQEIRELEDPEAPERPARARGHAAAAL
jgi:peptide deformylase